MFAIDYHVHIWQVSPQFSCGDTCQIWMWCKEPNRYCDRIENFPYGAINERSFSNPHRWPCQNPNSNVIVGVSRSRDDWRMIIEYDMYKASETFTARDMSFRQFSQIVHLLHWNGSCSVAEYGKAGCKYPRGGVLHFTLYNLHTNTTLSGP